MDRLVQQLCKELPRAGEAQVRNFVHQAMQHESPPESGHAPFPDTVRALLAAGASAGQVLAALLRCEWVSIRELTKSCQQGEPGGEGFCRNQVSALTACIQHYNDLQAIVVDEAETAWKQTLEEEKKHRVLAEARAHWLRNRVIELYNHFMEIPVRAQLEVVDVMEDEIVAMFCPEAAVVFAAADDLRSAWVSAGEGLRLRIWGRERRGNRLMLTVDRVETDERSRRRHVRIRLEEPAEVVLERRDGQRLTARIRDKSLQGMGVLLDADTDVSVGEHVRCQWTLDGATLQAAGIVRWHQCGEDGKRAGIEIRPDAAIRAHFQRMLMREQRTVIGRLRNLGLPAWLQERTEQ